jgi:hypothetical protein
MNVYKNIAVLLIFLLFGMINTGTAMNQAPPLPMVFAASNDMQDHSHSHDCASDGDDILSLRLEVILNSSCIGSDLNNFYDGNIPSGLSDLIWQPPK